MLVPPTKNLRNPIAQVKRLVWLLASDLKAKLSRVWIQGVVLFSHHNVAANIDNESNVPVVGSADIVDYLANYQAKSDIANNSKVVRDIPALKGA